MLPFFMCSRRSGSLLFCIFSKTGDLPGTVVYNVGITREEELFYE